MGTQWTRRDEPTLGFNAGLTVLWCLIFVALAAVPDQKILRHKLIAVEAGVWLTLCCVIVRWLREEEALWVRTPLDLPVALYAAGGVAFYAISPEPAVSSLELTRTLSCAATFFAAAQTFSRLKQPFPVLATWIVSAVFVAVYALLQPLGGIGPLALPQSARPIATFGNPIFLGAYFAASSILSFGAFLAAEELRTRAVWGASTAVLAAGIWATQSRAALVGIGAAALLAAALNSAGRRRWAILAGLAAAGLVGAAWFHAQGRQWTHALIWRDTLALWTQYPWLGCGLGRFHVEFPQHASQDLRALWPQREIIVNFAHNEYLQVLAETGIAGFGLLAGVIAAAAVWLPRAWGRLPLSPERIWLGSLSLAAAAIFAQNFFSPDIRFGLSSFLAFFCLGAAAGRAAGESVPLPAVPGRQGLAFLGAVFLLIWGSRALEPLSAQRRLSSSPGFHIEASREVDEELAQLEARLGADPANARLAEELAYLYAKRKDWPNALSRFQLASNIDPAKPGPLNNLGNIYYTLGERERAIAYWNKSLSVRPDQIDAHANLGKALYEVGNLKESARHLQAVLKLDPRNEKAQILLKQMIE